MRSSNSSVDPVQSAEATTDGFAPEDIDHDDSLIRWMLELSPTKRLAVAQGFVDSVRELRSGRRVTVPRHSPPVDST